MNCADAGRLQHAYLDGELELASALAVEGHLEHCARCRAAFDGLTALRAAIARACEPERAPQALRAGIERTLRTAPSATPVPRARAAWLAAAPGIAALLLAGWMLLAQPWRDDRAPLQYPMRAVYHIASAENVDASLRTLRNHLDATPGLQVVVVAHNAGIDFLLRGAVDENGRAFAETVRELRSRGVDFRVCTNTLTRRRLDPTAVIEDATLVPSGIAEIGRLQAREGYSYLRL